jgi:hypothetical protein
MGAGHAIKSDIFTLTIEGEVAAEPFLEALEQGMADPNFKAPMRALFDVRDAEAQAIIGIEEDHKGCHAEIGHCFIPHWAIVARSDTTLFNVARMICTLSDLRGADMRAYSDVSEARSQLTWSNFYQQDPFCRIQSVDCHPRFTPRGDAKTDNRSVVEKE